MRVLIDFGAIKAGGGVQLALNFIDLLMENVENKSEIFLLLPQSGPLSDKDLGSDWGGIYFSPRNYFYRLIYEEFILKRHLVSESIDVVFTFFGAGLSVPSSIKNIVSMAYPIVCYGDSAYWKNINTREKILKKLLNYFRLHRLSHADLLIVETEVMKFRLSSVINTCTDKILVLPPAPTEYVSFVEWQPPSSEIKILILSGNASHKNVWRLLPLISSLIEIGHESFKFQISMTKDSFLKDNRNTFDSELFSYIEFLGPIHPENIQDVYSSCDFLLSLSDLESFSNNYMEAWKSGTPLIVSDRDFARNICGDSAVYIEPHDSNSAAITISTLFNDHNKCCVMRNLGFELVSNLPTTEIRFNNIWNIINDIN